MPWKPPAASNLQRENDALKTTICCLRRELENKQGAVQRLEVLLCERLTRIDQLVAQVDQLRHQNKKLDAEAEHLAAMVADQRGMTAEPAQAQSQA
jgi:SMC interacting uncharacterized protein involved in chromosome segregation